MKMIKVVLSITFLALPFKGFAATLRDSRPSDPTYFHNNPWGKTTQLTNQTPYDVITLISFFHSKEPDPRFLHEVANSISDFASFHPSFMDRDPTVIFLRDVAFQMLGPGPGEIIAGDSIKPKYPYPFSQDSEKTKAKKLMALDKQFLAALTPFQQRRLPEFISEKVTKNINDEVETELVRAGWRAEVTVLPYESTVERPHMRLRRAVEEHKPNEELHARLRRIADELNPTSSDLTRRGLEELFEKKPVISPSNVGSHNVYVAGDDHQRLRLNSPSREPNLFDKLQRIRRRIRNWVNRLLS